MSKYRKKPVTIEAIQWTGDNMSDICKFTRRCGGELLIDGELYIKTLEGVHHASVGDFIIKGVRGELYPCKPDIFYETYEAVGTEVVTDREKLIEILETAESAVYWNSEDKSFVEKIADHLIANGVAVSKKETTTQRWISVEDEKPKRRGHYFISYVFRCPDIRFYGEAMWHDDAEGNGYVTGPHFSNEGRDGMRVTHWMEIPRILLPEPPKG